MTERTSKKPKKSGWKIKDEYLTSPVYSRGRSQMWMIGGKDLSIEKPPGKPVIREAIPMDKVVREFISIGVTGFFERTDLK